MATSSDKEKAVSKALRKLTKVLQQKMNGFDVNVGLYGCGQVTYSEYERIRASKSVPEANDEVFSVLQRRGPDILDALLEVLKEEEDANKHLIDKINEVYNPDDFKKENPPKGSDTSKIAPPVEATNELLGNGDWPAPMSSLPTAGTPTARTPTDAQSPTETIDFDPKKAYKMTARPRGVAIIINNRHFTCGMKERIGTDRDAESLTRLFIHLGFYTNRYDNLKGKDMHKKIKEAAQLDHNQFDCIMVAVLTHGISGKLYSTDGDLIPVEELTKYFDGLHCPALIGKPKIFILQACRGGKFDFGVESESTDLGEEAVKDLAETNYDKVEEKVLDYPEDFFKKADSKEETEGTDGGGGAFGTLPVESDFMLAYATVPGYVSWRNSEYGSWFVKAFTDTMFELTPSEHFGDIMIEVNRRVANDFQSKGRNKQIPSPVMMLTRKLYFRPGVYS